MSESYAVKDTDVMRFYRHVWTTHCGEDESKPVSVLTKAFNDELANMNIAASARWSPHSFDIWITFENPNDYDIFVLKWS